MEQSQKTGALGGAASGAGTGAMVGSVVPVIGTAVGAVVGGIIGGVGGYLGGGGEEEAEELGEEQARMIRRASRENQRKEKAVMRRTLGETKARTYASNILDTGSSRAYRGQMETEFKRDIRWNRSMADIQAQQAIKGGKAAADTIQKAGQQKAIGGIMDLGTAAAGGAFSKKPPNKLSGTGGLAAAETTAASPSEYRYEGSPYSLFGP